MLDIILDTLIDGLKLLPFLWFAFFIIELLEHKFYEQSKTVLKKAGKAGPLLGSILGCFPQCGFSVAATNLYVARIISLGTLISVYLSTSDEMLPVMLSHGSNLGDIFQLIGIKFIIGIIAGFIIDLMFRKKDDFSIKELCEEEHCHCEKGIFLSSMKHTLHTWLFIVGVSFCLNIVMFYGGMDIIYHLFQSNNFISPFLASLIGLIPNCAASVVITELYLNGVLSIGSAVSGLLTGSGVAILVLFRMNKDILENVKILLLVYFIGVFSGLILELVTFLW